MRQEGLRYSYGKPELCFCDRAISYSADQPVTLWDTAYSPYMFLQIFDQVQVEGENRVFPLSNTCKIDGAYPMPPEDPPAHHVPLGLFSLCSSIVLGLLVAKKGIARTTTSPFLESSLLYWVPCNYSHPTLVLKTLLSSPNTNTLISGPQVLLWTLSVQTIRDENYKVGQYD